MDRTLLLLIFSDILILSSFGLVAPILAIYIKEDLVGGSVVAAGISVTVFWITKSILQLPLSRFIDSRRKKTGFLLAGTLVIAIVPFIYMSAKSVFHIYIAQFIYAIGGAMAYPAWINLFTLHLNPKHRGFEWALWSTGIGIGTGITAFVGAKLAVLIGFNTVFLIVGIFSLIGMFILIFIDRSYERKMEKEFSILGNFLLCHKTRHHHR